MDKFGFGASGLGHDFAHTLSKGYNIRELSLSAAIALAYRILERTIDVGVYRQDYPIDLWNLKKDKDSNQTMVHQFSHAEVGGIVDAVRL